MKLVSLLLLINWIDVIFDLIIWLLWDLFDMYCVFCKFVKWIVRKLYVFSLYWFFLIVIDDYWIDFVGFVVFEIVVVVVSKYGGVLVGYCMLLDVLIFVLVIL